MKVDTNDLDKLNNSKKKRKGNTSKNKGKRGEYYFAERLTNIVGLNFQRIYTSGASVGKQNRKRLEQLTTGQAESQLGDIQSPEELKYFFIWESKNYGEIDIHNMLNTKLSTSIIGWLEELEYDVESALTTMKTKRTPIGFLCIKYTRKGNWVIGNYGYLKTLGFNLITNFDFDNEADYNKNKNNNSNVLIMPTPILNFQHKPRKTLLNNGYNNNYFICDFSLFFENNRESLFPVSEKRNELLKLIKELEKTE